MHLDNIPWYFTDHGFHVIFQTTEKHMIAKEMGQDSSTGASEEVIYKIDIPANRYDLLCLEGLSVALLIFQNKLSGFASF